MPIDIAGLRKRGTEVKVPFFDAEITITYDPITVSGALFRQEWHARRKELLADLSQWARDETERRNAVVLPEDFPGADQLAAAGIATYGDVPREAGELEAIKGIGPATAQRIIRHLNDDFAERTQEFKRRTELLYAELALLLARDWDLLEGGEPYALTAENIATLTGLGERICACVWNDANSLGNPRSSSA